jgi:hypothetical protein
VKRMALILAVAMVMSTIGGGMAAADPINSKNAEVFTANCGGEQIRFVVNFNSASVTAHQVGSTRNFVATRFAGTATFTDPETGQLVSEPFDTPIGKGKKKGLQGDLRTCTTTLRDVDPEVGPLTLELTITGFFTPRRG